MDISTFYALFSATCFAMLGFWWQLLQGHPEWLRDPATRTAVGGVYVSFGKFADVWQPTAGKTASSRPALGADLGGTKWAVPAASQETIGGEEYGAIELKPDGTFTATLHVQPAWQSITADTVIQDSFNQDNDGVDNKGGVINDSNVANGDQDDVGNTDIDTDIDDSFNEDNSDTDVIVDSGNETTTTTTTATESFNDTTTATTTEVNDSYNTDSSATLVDADDTPAADAVGV